MKMSTSSPPSVLGTMPPPAWVQKLQVLGKRASLSPSSTEDPGLIEAFNGSDGSLDLLINVGLLERAVSNCTADVLAGWSCDRCTDTNKPQERFFVSGESYGSSKANLLAGFRYGDVWIILVRGSHDLANWLSDAEIWPEPVPTTWSQKCDQGEPKCDHGFLQTWLSLETGLIKELTNRGVVPNDTKFSLLFTGHSLGSAACTLGAFSLWSKSYNILGNVNFESPKVFDSVAAECYEKILGSRTLRITNQNDFVVHAPSGYEHVGAELYARQGETYRCTYAEVKQCGGSHNSPDNNDACKCSSRDRVSLDFSQHCNTNHVLTFDFCQCNDSDTKVFWMAVLRNVIILLVLTAFLYVSYRINLHFRRGQTVPAWNDSSIASEPTGSSPHP